jgi:poly-gamma-glutamate capsule biosynthesis protein CapA/YwtB (metallophosphatase superfamily)
MKKYVPLDLPQNLNGFWLLFPPDVRKSMQDCIRQQYAEGNFRSTEDILCDEFNTVRFWSYYVQKAVDPITEPMKGSHLKEKFAPFRTCSFDLTPSGFSVDKEYRLSASGDLMRSKYLAESRDRFYDRVADLIFGADCAIANFESSIAPGVPNGRDVIESSGTLQIGLTMPEYETLKQHKGRKFDVLQLANNHVMDNGEEGIMLNMNTLTKDGIDYIGTYKTEEASKQVKTTKMGDVTIGWVCHTFWVNNKPLPPDKPWIVDITLFDLVENLDTLRIGAQIKAARAAGCDLVLLVLHWGAEWEFYPNPKQLGCAHKLTELGADAIIAQHPHVIQPIEIYRPHSDPDKQVPILYSLGNLTPIAAPPYTVVSLVANLRVSAGKLNGEKRTMVTGLEITPVACVAEQDDDGSMHAALVPLADLEKMNLERGTRDYVNSIMKYADLVLGTDWRKQDLAEPHHQWFAAERAVEPG